MSAPVLPPSLPEELLPPPPETIPCVDNWVIEDDTPVDNICSERQQRLLVNPLYDSWAGPGEGRSCH